MGGLPSRAPRADRTAGIVRTTPMRTYAPILTPPAPAELSAADIERYTGCPRRFFYESVLQLSRRSRTGAYLDAHGCLQRVLRYVRELPQGITYDRAEAEAVFEQAWTDSKLEEHPFAPAYRRLTTAMLDRLHLSSAGAASGSRRTCRSC